LTNTLLEHIKHDLLKSGQIDSLIANPESIWTFTDMMNGRVYEITMEVREGRKSAGSVTTADDISFMVYEQLPQSIVNKLSTNKSLSVAYRFDEDKLLTEIKAYIDGTYSKHYATNGGIQAMDAITATGAGVGFCVGNILKYAWRLGKKDGFNKLDIMKVIHYSIILMFIMKKETK